MTRSLIKSHPKYFKISKPQLFHCFISVKIKQTAKLKRVFSNFSQNKRNIGGLFESFYQQIFCKSKEILHFVSFLIMCNLSVDTFYLICLYLTVHSSSNQPHKSAGNVNK